MIKTYLTVSIYRELYAINIEKVLEVLEKQPVTEVPNTSEFIMGIINFRGEVVPIFDTRKKFNLPERSENDSYVIAILDLSDESEVYRVGAVVDKVRDVITIENSEIKPVPTMSKEFNADFLYGVARRDEQFLLMMNVDKVYSICTVSNSQNSK